MVDAYPFIQEGKRMPSTDLDDLKRNNPKEWATINHFVKRLEKLAKSCNVPELIIEGKKLVKFAVSKVYLSIFFV
jgi:hypothetical protein